MIKHYHYRIGLLFKYVLPLGSYTFAFRVSILKYMVIVICHATSECRPGTTDWSHSERYVTSQKKITRKIWNWHLYSRNSLDVDKLDGHCQIGSINLMLQWYRILLRSRDETVLSVQYLNFHLPHHGNDCSTHSDLLLTEMYVLFMLRNANLFHCNKTITQFP